MVKIYLVKKIHQHFKLKLNVALKNQKVISNSIRKLFFFLIIYWFRFCFQYTQLAWYLSWIVVFSIFEKDTALSPPVFGTPNIKTDTLFVGNVWWCHLGPSARTKMVSLLRPCRMMIAVGTFVLANFLLFIFATKTRKMKPISNLNKQTELIIWLISQQVWVCLCFCYIDYYI